MSVDELAWGKLVTDAPTAVADPAGGSAPRRPGPEIAGPFQTVAEVASRMRVSKMTVYRLVHSGELPAIRFGRTFQVPRSAVEELIGRPRYHDAP